MIPVAFDYEVAESVDHAIDLLGQHGDEAKLLAGGHSLLPIMKLRLAAPTVLVDLGRIGDLNYVNDEGDHLAIGGSISHGDAASDLPSALLALDANFVVKGPGGERTVVAGDFFEDYLQTTLAPDEVLTEIRVPKLGGAGWSYKKFNRRAQDWAVVGVAAVVEPSSVAEATSSADEGTSPTSDIAASDEYRRHLARVLSRRAVEEALGRLTLRPADAGGPCPPAFLIFMGWGC